MTGHSQKIVPGLEAFNHVRNAKPGPERSEGPPSPKDRARTGRMACGDAYSGDPKRSEGPASNTGFYVKREPDHSEGSPAPRKIWPRAFARAAKRSALAAVAQHLLGPAASAI